MSQTDKGIAPASPREAEMDKSEKERREHWRHCPGGSWPLGKVLEAKPDERGLVLPVKSRAKASITERPMVKLCCFLEDKE